MIDHEPWGDTSTILGWQYLTNRLRPLQLFLKPPPPFSPSSMRLSSLCPLALALLPSLVRGDGHAASDVLSLTASTFESSVNPEPLILVEFFAPW